MPVIRTESLSKFYKPGLGKADVPALVDLTLSVEEHEIFGFLGPNGAGKTTTMKILMGLIYPSSGSAWIFDRPVGDVEAKRELGFLPEHPYFYDQLTGSEILDYFGRLFGIATAERNRRTKDLLERVGLGHAANQRLRGYSKGMLQRIGIAQALVNDPKLVVLDEPMSGLDPLGRKEVRDLILSLRDEKRSVFFSTHILSDIEVVCDRVAILSKGRLATLSSLQDLLQIAGDSMEVVLVGASESAKTRVAAIPGASISQAADRLVVRIPEPDLTTVITTARENGAKILSVSGARRSLEEIFVQTAGKSGRE